MGLRSRGGSGNRSRLSSAVRSRTCALAKAPQDSLEGEGRQRVEVGASTSPHPTTGSGAVARALTVMTTDRPAPWPRLAWSRPHPWLCIASQSRCRCSLLTLDTQNSRDSPCFAVFNHSSSSSLSWTAGLFGGAGTSRDDEDSAASSFRLRALAGDAMESLDSMVAGLSGTENGAAKAGGLEDEDVEKECDDGVDDDEKSAS